MLLFTLSLKPGFCASIWSKSSLYVVSMLSVSSVVGVVWFDVVVMVAVPNWTGKPLAD